MLLPLCRRGLSGPDLSIRHVYYLDMSSRQTHMPIMLTKPPNLSEGPTLADLAAASGLEPRTIRSWIAQGLLPPPLTRGPSARYPADATQRLLAIVAMKEMLGMSLADIRLELLSANAEKIASYAARVPGLPPRASAALRQGKAADATAALDYIAQVRAESPASEPRLEEQKELFAQPAPIGLEALEFRLGGPKPAPMRRSRTDEWLRIPITPDLELHARGPLDPEQRARLERCANLIRNILLGS